MQTACVAPRYPVPITVSFGAPGISGSTVSHSSATLRSSGTRCGADQEWPAGEDEDCRCEGRAERDCGCEVMGCLSGSVGAREVVRGQVQSMLVSPLPAAWATLEQVTTLPSCCLVTLRA